MSANIADPIVRRFQPDNIFMPIWRYMVLEQFVDLVESKTLRFTSIDQYPDQYEGHNTMVGKIVANLQSDSAGLAVWSDNLINAFIRESSYVNCWAEGPAENAAFWEIKGTCGTAVAIRSNYSGLRNVLPEEYVVGCVKYVDYKSARPFTVAGLDSSFPFLEHVYHKRLEYSYEKEIRAARLPRSGAQDKPPSADVVICNLSDLIDFVCIRRNDPERKRVEDLCSKHNLKFRESRINDPPLQIRLSEQHREILVNKIAAAKLPGDLREEFFAVAITRLLGQTLRGE